MSASRSTSQQSDRTGRLAPLRRWLPVVLMLIIAGATELCRSPVTPGVAAAPVAAAIDTLPPSMRTIAITSAVDERPDVVQGDRVDVYAIDPLTGQIVKVIDNGEVTAADDRRVVVAIAVEQVVGVAAASVTRSFTIVGR